MSIKVYIQTEKFKGGPAVFRSRLIDVFGKMGGIQVVTNVNTQFDIELAFIRRVRKHKKPYILRVDGCYYMKGQLSNDPLISAIKKARYLIFQSQFALKLCNHVLGLGLKSKYQDIKYSIIYNGIDLNYIESIKPDKHIPKDSFICCAKWRHNKRPQSTIKGFLKANTGKHLYMIGGAGLGGKKISNKYNSKYIHIIGDKSNEEIISIMKACSYQIHLCHIDSCPNIVIEGLACGLNVLCTNLGGTKELVKNDGIVLNVDSFWPKRQLPNMDLDNVRHDVVSNGIKKLLKIKNRSCRPDLDIQSVADNYIKIIKQNIGV